MPYRSFVSCNKQYLSTLRRFTFACPFQLFLCVGNLGNFGKPFDFLGICASQLVPGVSEFGLNLDSLPLRKKEDFTGLA